MPLLAAHARTFTHKARLAVTLSWIAGFVNVTIVAVCGTTVSHVTGNVTTFGLHLAENLSGREMLGPVLFLMHLPAGFLLGAMLSQTLLRFGQTLHGVRPAALPMTAEVVLLALLAVALGEFRSSGHATFWLWAVTSLGVVAMGLQNATVTRISGSVVRTTHLTGVTTDFGIELVDLFIWTARRLKGGRSAVAKIHRHASARRLVILAAIWWSFFLGAILGAIVCVRWPKLGLWPPTAFLVLLLATDLWAITRRRRTIEDKRRTRRARYNAPADDRRPRPIP